MPDKSGWMAANIFLAHLCKGSGSACQSEGTTIAPGEAAEKSPLTSFATLRRKISRPAREETISAEIRRNGKRRMIQDMQWTIAKLAR